VLTSLVALSSHDSAARGLNRPVDDVRWYRLIASFHNVHDTVSVHLSMTSQDIAAEHKRRASEQDRQQQEREREARLERLRKQVEVTVER
jgi:hypothetical protein